MSDTLLSFCLTSLCWWGVMSAAYAALLFGLDALLTTWKRRHQARRQLCQELARIDREAEASVQRIGAAFVVAQQLLREQAAAGRGGRR